MPQTLCIRSGSKGWQERLGGGQATRTWRTSSIFPRRPASAAAPCTPAAPTIGASEPGPCKQNHHPFPDAQSLSGLTAPLSCLSTKQRLRDREPLPPHRDSYHRSTITHCKADVHRSIASTVLMLVADSITPGHCTTGNIRITAAVSQKVRASGSIDLPLSGVRFYQAHQRKKEPKLLFSIHLLDVDEDV